MRIRQMLNVAKWQVALGQTEFWARSLVNRE